MRILIAGCGDVGNHLAQILLADGHVVYGLKRNTSSLPSGVIPVSADLTNAETLDGLPTHIDWLVFMPTPGRRDRDAYHAIFVEGWRNLWDHLRDKPRRTVIVSSTAVYGEDKGEEVDEETEAKPARFNGEVLLEMEARAGRDTEGLIVARVSGIYGPGRERLIKLARSPGAEVQRHPAMYTNRIHRDDVARAIQHLLELEAPGNLYLVTDDLPAPRHDVMAWLARAQGLPEPDAVELPGASSGKRASNRKLRASGFELLYPDYRAGYGKILGL
jgi:nucleoside-diphosphate-sugar epimerase